MGNTEVIIVTSISTAVSTQLAIVLYEAYKQWNHKRGVRKLIKSDLVRLDGLLLNMHNDFNNMANQLGKIEEPDVPAQEYPTFSADVYKSIPLTTIYDAVHENILLVMEVYKHIEYRSERTPSICHKEILRIGYQKIDGYRLFALQAKGNCIIDRDNIDSERKRISNLISKL